MKWGWGLPAGRQARGSVPCKNMQGVELKTFQICIRKAVSLCTIKGTELLALHFLGSREEGVKSVALSFPKLCIRLSVCFEREVSCSHRFQVAPYFQIIRLSNLAKNMLFGES